MNFLSVLSQVIILFAIMFLGYYLRVKTLINEESITNYSRLIFYVTMPAMILSAMSKSHNILIHEVMDVIIVAIISYTFLFIMAFVMPKIVRVANDYVGLYRFMAMFGNVGFIGYPMLLAILGEEALFIGSVFNIPYNLLLYTVGIYFITFDADQARKLDLSYKQFVNPGLMATVIGLILFFLHIQLPKIIVDGTTMLGNITTPLSMIVIGGSLYDAKISNILSKHKILIYCVLKMIIFPLLLAVILTSIGITGMTRGVAVILCSMPIAANTVIISKEYKGHVTEASEAVFISTLFLILSTPIIMLIINGL
ncbi:AEC family transporter [Vallitalea pronyensis]|uniref:AEC family transporter n=1 Tax=Vallitalea pronyensis TaxID=1348613 RepID=A0A8J8MP14_9FIRM|nr:AEC family transporter [Vallitalea pronyensis]QUI24951.1 AEC family transporter [Vallitalea pronyensis]